MLKIHALWHCGTKFVANSEVDVPHCKYCILAVLLDMFHTNVGGLAMNSDIYRLQQGIFLGFWGHYVLGFLHQQILC